jgi:hypothetical protein
MALGISEKWPERSTILINPLVNPSLTHCAAEDLGLVVLLTFNLPIIYPFSQPAAAL